MTLFRHLAWLVLFFSFFIQCGSASLFIWHSYSTIQESHQNQAKNTAEFLLNSIVISKNNPQAKTMSDQNLSTIIEQLANPLIESGQFNQIAVISEQKVIYSQQLPLAINAVPQWFEKRYGFGSSLTTVMRQIHQQAFEIAIEMNEKKANYRLYNTIKSATLWVLIGMIATGITLFYALKRLLLPLANLEEHAKAISLKQFDHKIPMPPTRELQQVVLSMNQMSNKLQHIFQEQHQIIQHSRTLAFEDLLTSLPNAFAFENSIKTMANSCEEAKIGFIILSQLDGLAQENKLSGRLKADQSIQYYGKLWDNTWQLLEQEYSVARRNSSSFFAWIQTQNYSALLRAIGQLNTQFQAAQSKGDIGQALKLHMSIHYFDTQQSYAKWSTICATLEHNVQCAIEQKSLCIGPDHKACDTLLMPNSMAFFNLSNTDWNLILTRAITEKNVVLEFQPIFMLDKKKPAIAECFMRLPHQNNLLKPAQIWPIIEQFNLTYAFDRLIIKIALAHLIEHPNQRLAINVCDTTFNNAQFPLWLESTLHDYPDIIDCLYLDIQESFLKNPAAIAQLIQLKSIGVSLILDQVIAQKTTIDQFVRLPISALKMNIQFLRRNYDEQRVLESLHQPLANEHYQKLFITDLLTLCRACDVEILTTGIESQEDSDFARSLDVQGIQGYWVCPALHSYGDCENWSQAQHRFTG